MGISWDRTRRWSAIEHYLAFLLIVNGSVEMCLFYWSNPLCWSHGFQDWFRNDHGLQYKVHGAFKLYNMFRLWEKIAYILCYQMKERERRQGRNIGFNIYFCTVDRNSIVGNGEWARNPLIYPPPLQM